MRPCNVPSAGDVGKTEMRVHILCLCKNGHKPVNIADILETSYA